MAITLTTTSKNWLALNAGLNTPGVSNCFSSTGISYTDPDGTLRSGGTGDVLNAFYVAHLIGHDTTQIIANTDYNGFKVINSATDIGLDDVNFAYANDGHAGPAYCVPLGNASFTSGPTNARIWIDGSDTGAYTPSTIINLLTGTHDYRLVLAGYRDATGNFSVTSGTTIPVPLTFLASAYFSSTPTGARIYIDNTDMGINTPNTITGVTTGGHSYKLVLSGYVDATGNFTATPGTTTNISATLYTPAHIVSSLLTVDTNSCISPCTVNGNVHWTNDGGTPGISDLAIVVNTVPTSIDTGVTINQGETKSYPFTMSNLSAGTYNVHASPDSGTVTQVIVVRLPANMCEWVTSRGGRSNIATFDIMSLVSGYLLQINLGFTVSAAHIMGAVAFYLGNLTSGNSLTGCSFT